jgi:hypothetical protein
MDIDVYREIRIELARRDIKMAHLIEDMWFAYADSGRPERPHPPAGSKRGQANGARA